MQLDLGVWMASVGGPFQLNVSRPDYLTPPNGRYIRVAVNPTGLLSETSMENNVSYRRVRLKGSPGHRTVVVPPYFGIDTESDCLFCY